MFILLITRGCGGVFSNFEVFVTENYHHSSFPVCCICTVGEVGSVRGQTKQPVLGAESLNLPWSQMIHQWPNLCICHVAR